MTRYISTTDTAKLIRQALKAAFPGITFSVRSSSYSGGSSIDVSYVDGPRAKDIEAVAGRFAGATFDGMIDLKSHHASEWKGEQVHFGPDFVFVRQEISAARKAATAAAILDLDDRCLNNLEAAMSMGRFGVYAGREAMHPGHYDWAMFVRVVAAATTPEAMAAG